MRSWWQHRKIGTKWVGLALVITGLSVLLKIALLGAEVFPFNADEAVVGLMARHILQGARPIFFYGQAYMGSLDAWLVALGFALLGEHVEVIRLVQVLLYALTVFSAILLGWMLWEDRRIGLLVGVFLAIPNVNVTLYTTVSLGGYGEALLIGNLILITAVLLVREDRSEGLIRRVPWGLWSLLGFWIGLGLWVHGMTLVYSVPAIGVVTWYFRHQREIAKRMAMLGIGFFLGSLPWWYFALTQGWKPLLTELLGSAVAVEEGAWWQRTLQHAFNLIVLGSTVTLGFRPPWAVQWLGLPLMPFVLSLWMLVAWEGIRGWWSTRSITLASSLLLGIGLTLGAGFLFTSFGVDPSGRYFLPLALPLAFGAARWIARLSSKGLRLLCTMLIPLYHLWGIGICAAQNPPGITTQFYAPTQIDQRHLPALSAFLEQAGETRGYSNYWVAYPLAFISQEELIFAPRLPYHLDLRYTSRDDRYPTYTLMVSQSERVAYITTHNPALDDYLRQAFDRLNISYQEAQIGDYRIYYRLSRPVHPHEIGLGETHP